MRLSRQTLNERGERNMDEKDLNVTPSENKETNSTPDLTGLFTKLSEDLGKQMERYFTSGAKKEADNYGLTAEQKQEAAKDFLNKNKTKETLLTEENENLKKQMKTMKADSVLSNIFSKLEVNTDLKDDLMKMVNVDDFYNEKDEIKSDDLEKAFSEVITRIPSFKKQKETPNVQFGQDLMTTEKQQKKQAKSMEEIAREMLGLTKKNEK